MFEHLYIGKGDWSGQSKCWGGQARESVCAMRLLCMCVCVCVCVCDVTCVYVCVYVYIRCVCVYVCVCARACARVECRASLPVCWAVLSKNGAYSRCAACTTPASSWWRVPWMISLSCVCFLCFMYTTLVRDVLLTWRVCLQVGTIANFNWRALRSSQGWSSCAYDEWLRHSRYTHTHTHTHLYVDIYRYIDVRIYI